jgi:hypothetical protein
LVRGVEKEPALCIEEGELFLRLCGDTTRGDSSSSEIDGGDNAGAPSLDVNDDRGDASTSSGIALIRIRRFSSSDNDDRRANTFRVGEAFNDDRPGEDGAED